MTMRIDEVTDDMHAVVLVAGYSDPDKAHEDFIELNRRIKNKSVEIRAAALVNEGPDGEAAVTHAVNHHGRVAAGWGAGVGALLGLFAPPILASVVVGAAAAAIVASFADHEIDTGLRREIGHALTHGTAVILVLASPNGAVKAAQVINHARQLSALPMDEMTLNTLDQAAAEVSAAVAAGPRD
ncbi:sulfatase [Mycolicibacterium monacense]|nr:sulfatase [Mycolicibacterium monacense DSM 44395]OBB75589.1 sulfatase [Mycolicibacterium monacense]OBF47034.1 sulfatase [Mycolicibacterium monacense]ORB23353.1 sulfatase [Mycolicibacterium monacense DSM 44395]QHP85088.1 DUF1269 domain-containing protein [Mycolicibacterium monacense DSM 44395]